MFDIIIFIFCHLLQTIRYSVLNYKRLKWEACRLSRVEESESEVLNKLKKKKILVGILYKYLCIIRCTLALVE